MSWFAVERFYCGEEIPARSIPLEAATGRSPAAATFSAMVEPVFCTDSQHTPAGFQEFHSNKSLMHHVVAHRFGGLNPGKIKTITILLLVVGLGSALAIYLTAEPAVVDPLLGEPLTNKKYVHELRTLGGKGNVLAAEFIDWFAALWHGRNLAGTVTVLTAVATLTFRFVAARPDLYASASGEDESPPPGNS